jgi:hypothetical protein
MEILMIIGSRELHMVEWIKPAERGFEKVSSLGFRMKDLSDIEWRINSQVVLGGCEKRLCIYSRAVT